MPDQMRLFCAGCGGTVMMSVLKGAGIAQCPNGHVLFHNEATGAWNPPRDSNSPALVAAVLRLEDKVVTNSSSHTAVEGQTHATA